MTPKKLGSVRVIEIWCLLVIGAWNLVIPLPGSSFLLPDLLQLEIIYNHFETIVTGTTSNTASGVHIGRADVHIFEEGNTIA